MTGMTFGGDRSISYYPAHAKCFPLQRWVPHDDTVVQSATEKAHDVKKAGEGKKKAAPKKVNIVPALVALGMASALLHPYI